MKLKTALEIVWHYLPEKPWNNSDDLKPAWKVVKNAALKSIGRRKTVRSALRQRRNKVCPRCDGFGFIPIDMNRGGRCYRCRGKGRILPVNRVRERIKV